MSREEAINTLQPAVRAGDFPTLVAADPYDVILAAAQVGAGLVLDVYLVAQPAIFLVALEDMLDELNMVRVHHLLRTYTRNKVVPGNGAELLRNALGKHERVRLGLVRQLLEAGARLDTFTWRPTHPGSIPDEPELVQLLLEYHPTSINKAELDWALTCGHAAGVQGLLTVRPALSQEAEIWFMHNLSHAPLSENYVRIVVALARAGRLAPLQPAAQQQVFGPLGPGYWLMVRDMKLRQKLGWPAPVYGPALATVLPRDLVQYGSQATRAAPQAPYVLARL